MKTYTVKTPTETLTIEADYYDEKDGRALFFTAAEDLSIKMVCSIPEPFSITESASESE